MPTPAPLALSFGETLWANGVGALSTAFFTALFVTVGATLVVKNVESRENQRREREKSDRAAALVTIRQDRADLRRELALKQSERQQDREHEFQTRSALRETYSRLLVAQRRSRQASIALSVAENRARDADRVAARQAHDDFIDEYHRLALDADESMWRELRGLRDVLDDMLACAQSGDADK
jgi:hypothetical protein